MGWGGARTGVHDEDSGRRRRRRRTPPPPLILATHPSSAPPSVVAVAVMAVVAVPLLGARFARLRSIVGRIAGGSTLFATMAQFFNCDASKR